MLKRNLLTAFVCGAITFFVCAATLSAQTSVSISPALLDANVKPGASYTQSYTLINNSSERLMYRPSIADLFIDGSTGRSGTAGTPFRSAAQWVQFSPSEILIEPHSSGVIKANVSVPLNASGSFYAVPIFEAAVVAKTADPKAGTSTTSKASIGIRFRAVMMLTTVTGAEYNVEIMNASIKPPTAASELELDLDVRNRGNSHAKMRGAFAILDSTGKLSGHGPIEEKRVLPGQLKLLANKWSGELKPGEYTAIVTLSYDRVGLEPVSLVREVFFNVK